MKLKFCINFFFVFALSFPEIHAQNLNVVDSLNARFANSNGRERISILLALARYHQNNEQKKTIRYANKSILLSEKYNDQLNIGRAHILIGGACTVLGKFDEAEKHLEKAKDIFSVVKSENDEAKLYRYIGEFYIKTNDSDEAAKYYQKSLAISKKLQNNKEIGWSMNGLVKIYSEKREFEKAQNIALEALKFAKLSNDSYLQIDTHINIADLMYHQMDTIEHIKGHYNKALEIAKKIDDKEKIAAIYLDMLAFLNRKGEFKEAEKYSFIALKICEDNKYYYKISIIYSNLGITSFLVKGDYKLSIDYLNKSLEMAKIANHEEQIINVYGYLGGVYIEKGDYKKGIDFLYKTLSFYEKSNNKFLLQGIYNNIGEAFYLLNDFKMAEENYQKSLLLFKETKEQKGIGISSLNIGRVKVKQKLFDEAIYYLEEAYKVFQRGSYSREILLYYDAIVECMQRQGKVEEALNYMQEALMLDEELQEYEKVASELYTRLGTIYYELKEYKKAEMFFQKSLNSSIIIESQKEIKDNYFWLSKCYEKLNKYEKGLEYYKKYTIIKDSLFNLSKMGQIADIQIKYNTDKKEKEILLLQKEKEYQTILFNNQKNELYRVNLEKDLERERKEHDIIRLKAARKQSEIEQLNMQNNLQIAEKEIKNNQLSIQKSHLARELLIRNIIIGGGVLVLIVLFLALMYYRQRLKTQKTIARKEIEAINASIYGKERERKRIAKELHDGIGGNLAAIKLDLSKLSNNANHELQKIIKNVDGTYNEVRTLSHDLIPPKILKNSFEKLIKDYLGSLSKTCSFIINNDFYPSSRFNQLTDKMKIELYRITQELMNNIIKHAHADQVDLQFTIFDKRIKFIIEDNGVGFDAENISKGIGLNNILSRTKALNGNMYIDTLISRGTIIEIDIPIEEKENDSKFK